MTAFLPKQVKLFADGANLLAGDAGVGRLQGRPHGRLDDGPRRLRPLDEDLLDLGYQIHVHVNGDAGLDMVLDQLELNMRRIRASTPHRDRPFRGLQARAGGADQAPGRDRERERLLPDRNSLTTNRSNGLDPERADRWCGWATSRRPDLIFVPLGHADGPGQPLFSCGPA